MTRPFAGPDTITRDGETYTEWHIVGPTGIPTITLRSRGGLSYLVDCVTGEEVLILRSEIGPVAAMITDAQQHLTGGQR